MRTICGIVTAASLVAACGSPERDVRTTGIDDRLVEVGGDGEVVPGGGQTVGAGHVALYGSYGAAPDGSGDLWRSRKVLDLDLASGARRWVEVPENLWIAEAVATRSGLVVVGGPCSHGDVVPAHETDDASCPETITASYRLAWGSQRWERVGFRDAPATSAHIEGGGVTAHGDTAYMVLRTSADGSSVFSSSAGGDWTLIADDLGRGLPPCATTDGLIVLERTLDADRPDHVEGRRLRQVGVDGTMQDIPLPADVPNDSHGGIGVVVGCLEDGPLVVYGGSTPTDDAPVRVAHYENDTWLDVPGELSANSSGGLPSRIWSGHGSATFSLASPSAEGAVQRTAHLITSDGQGVEAIELMAEGDVGPLDAETYLLHDSTTRSLVRIGYTTGSTTISWS